MVFVAAAVKHDSFNTGCLSALCYKLTNALCFSGLVQIGCGTKLCFHSGGGGQGHALDIVDNLNEHVTARTGDAQARTRSGTRNILADASVTACTLPDVVAHGDKVLTQ